MAAPDGRPRRRGSVIGPLMLIFIGGVFLLQNAGIVAPTVWGNLWRLWPVVLVLVGIELLFGSRAGWLVGIVGLVAVGAALSFAAGWNFDPHVTASRSPAVTRTFRTDVGSAQQASVTVRFGAGQLEIGPLGGGAPEQLASMTYEGPTELVAEPNYSVVGGNGRLEYQLNGRGGSALMPFTDDRNSPHMAINLAPNVPITTLLVQSGAADAKLDLSSLRVTNLDLAVGAAATRVRLPDAGVTNVHISSGASTLTLEIPPGVAARIRHRGGLSTLNVDQTRFPASGDDRYQSSDWETAQNKADISLETGVTTIQIQ
jgi:Domain of unknown function (DUF5668)